MRRRTAPCFFWPVPPPAPKATLRAARNGRTQLVRLTQRYGGNPLPTVKIVDMRAELASGNPREISLSLEDAIRRNLDAGKQTILLLNRRGYQTMAQCDDCREVLKCPKCSVPMVYHKAGHKLLCHYCGTQLDPPPKSLPRLRRKAALPGLRHPEGRGGIGGAVPRGPGAAHGSGFHCR